MYTPLLVLKDTDQEQVSVPASVRNDPAGELMWLSSRKMSGRECTPPAGARGQSAFVWHRLFLAFLPDLRRKEKIKEAHFASVPAEQLI